MIAHAQRGIQELISILALPFEMWTVALDLPFPDNIVVLGVLSGHLLSSAFLTLVIMVSLKEWAQKP